MVFLFIDTWLIKGAFQRMFSTLPVSAYTLSLELWGFPLWNKPTRDLFLLVLAPRSLVSSKLVVVTNNRVMSAWVPHQRKFDKNIPKCLWNTEKLKLQYLTELKSLKYLTLWEKAPPHFWKQFPEVWPSECLLCLLYNQDPIDHTVLCSEAISL